MYVSPLAVTMATALGSQSLCRMIFRGDLSCSICDSSWKEESLRRGGTGEGGARREWYVCESLTCYYMTTAVGCLSPSKVTS